MKQSPQLQGSHITASPSGHYIAAIAKGRLRIHPAHAPERFTDVTTKIQNKEVTAIKWSDDDERIAIVSNRLIEVLDLVNSDHRIRLDNGSGGLGKFASVDFIGVEQLLVIWEFGKAKVWNFANGKGTDLADVKTTCSGERLQVRPATGVDAKATALATLSRHGVDDMLCFYLPASQKVLAPGKLPTTDAQSLSWSPDGRWLAVLDSPTASPSVHFYTADGHLFRSYPPSKEHVESGLGIKSIAWARNSGAVGLARFDGKVVLLNTRTFTSLAVIEHNTTIDQSGQRPDQQAPIWQEAVSASGERSYTAISQPFSPPLSQSKPSTDPVELGVAEACFSPNGSYLATRDERMLNSVWIWNVGRLVAHAVIVQHSNVRRMQWHPTKSDELLLDCGESIGYVFRASAPREPCTPSRTSFTGSSSISWLKTEQGAPSILLCSTRASFILLYPEGRPTELQDTGQNGDQTFVSEGAKEDGDDSLLDLLTGKTPLPPKTEQSYTERVDLEVEDEEGDSTARMDDTFRGKQVNGRSNEASGRAVEQERDPLDDSDIF